MKTRLPLIILGIALALVVTVVIFVVIKVGRGTPVDLPVAVADIPPDTALDPSMFRLQQVRGLDRSTLESTVEADEFAAVVGHETLEMVHAGSPLLWAAVDPEQQAHLTLALSDPAHLVYPLPVTADQVGDFLAAGDYVDVIFTLGRVAAQEMVHVEAWEYDGPAPPGLCRSGTVTATSALCPGDPLSYTTLLHLPLAKVVLADARVMRVEREVIRSASTSYGMGTDEEESRPRTTEGEIIRIYLELDREQAEILSFALHNGALNLPARAVPAGGASEGFTWEDFQELFFQGRPEAELRGEE
ncbi:MAG: hypothetical protein JW900_11495 [Anaerolineae bacterium]|nr:hypothetical protein [Anaerolineae bacterium]